MSLRLAAILNGIYAVMRYSSWRYPAYRAQLAEHDFVGQIRTRDTGIGRWFEIKAGTVRSGAGIHSKPDVTLNYESAAVRRSTGRSRSKRQRRSA